MNGAPRFVDERDFERVQRQVLDLVSRAQCDRLDVVLDGHFAQEPIGILVQPWAECKRKFSFSVDGDASDTIPRLLQELDADMILN